MYLQSNNIWMTKSNTVGLAELVERRRDMRN